MTHEAGIEAAATVAFDWSGNAFYPDFEMDTSEYVTRVIQAYLSASGMVLVPREPTQEMKAAWYSDLDPWFNEKIEAEWHMWNVMLDAAPNPFKSKP